MPRGYKITPNFDTLSKTINLLGSELGNVIKDQAGTKYFKIVEDIRLNSKKYRQTNNNKYLDSIFKTLQSLEPNEIYIITKAFTIFFYLSNIAEQVFREHTLKNSNISVSKKTSKELINVFVPTTPNPTSGFLLMFPKDEVIYLDMTFEEASKFIVSAGTSDPADI